MRLNFSRHLFVHIISVIWPLFFGPLGSPKTVSFFSSSTRLPSRSYPSCHPPRPLDVPVHLRLKIHDMELWTPLLPSGMQQPMCWLVLLYEGRRPRRKMRLLGTCSKFHSNPDSWLETVSWAAAGPSSHIPFRLAC